MTYESFLNTLRMLLEHAKKAGLRPDVIRSNLEDVATSLGDDFELTSLVDNDRRGAIEILWEQDRTFSAYKDQTEHDDGLTDGELLEAALFYIEASRGDYIGYHRTCRWPDNLGSAPPNLSDRRQNLIKAGALIASEIDRHDRKK
jgi:hypothetical protein